VTAISPSMQDDVRERLAKRAHEIEVHVAKYPGYYPEAIQHAADLREVLAFQPNTRVLELLTLLDRFGASVKPQPGEHVALVKGERVGGELVDASVYAWRTVGDIAKELRQELTGGVG